MLARLRASAAHHSLSPSEILIVALILAVFALTVASGVRHRLRASEPLVLAGLTIPASGPERSA